MKKLSKLTESIWSDIRSRSNCESTKKEECTIENLQNKIIEIYNSSEDKSYLDLRGLSVSGYTSFESLFEELYMMFYENVKIIDVTGWDTSSVTNMKSLFDGYDYLTNIIGLDTWDVSNVTDMNSMFSGCKNLTELNINSWDVSNVTDMNSMFNDCPDKILPSWYKMNESIWSDIRDRSNGGSLKKEDEPGNIRELEPVDLGLSVMWADRDLEIDGNKKFNVSFVKSLPEKILGWRLPTRDEADELFKGEWSCDEKLFPKQFKIQISHNKKSIEFILFVGERPYYYEDKGFNDDSWFAFSFHKDASFFPHSVYSSIEGSKNSGKIRLVKDYD